MTGSAAPELNGRQAARLLDPRLTKTYPSPYRSSAKLTKAIWRARFTATVNTRWCCRQFPEMRRGTIRPRSVRKFRNRPTSLKSIGALSTQNRHGLRR